MTTRPKIILTQAGPATSPRNIIENADHIKSLPYDGIRVGLYWSEIMMKEGNVLDRGDVEWQLDGFKDFNVGMDNYLSVKIQGPGGPNDPGAFYNDAEWARVTENFRLLAEIAKEYGFKGIMFDNEEYSKDAKWLNAPDYSTRSENTLELANIVAARGRDIGEAIATEFPDISFAVFHSVAGSVWSEDKPRIMGDPNNQELRGPFSTGIFEGLGPDAHLVDLGEDYRLRTDEEFAAHTDYRDNRLGEVALWDIDPDLRENWAERVDQGHMTYTHPTWGGEMDPEIMVDVLLKSLVHGEGLVAMYSSHVAGRNNEGNIDLVTPDFTDPAWNDAVRKAIALYERDYATDDYAEEQFTTYLVNAATDDIIAVLGDGEKVYLGDTKAEDLSVVVKSDKTDIESVRLKIGDTVQVENFAPFALFGNRGDDIFQARAAGNDGIALGQQEIYIDAFSKDGAAGDVLGRTSISFELIEGEEPETAFRVFLVDGETDEKIVEITKGAHIDAGMALLSNLSIVVETDDAQAESVKFEIGDYKSIENLLPYALFGDGIATDRGAEDIWGGSLDVGEIILNLTAFDQDFGRGDIVAREEFQFELLQQKEDEQPAEDLHMVAAAFPEDLTF